MKSLARILATIILASPACIFAGSSVTPHEQTQMSENKLDDIQNLLMTHGVLLNKLIVAAHFDKPQSDMDAIKEKLFTNAHDIATYLSTYCGTEAGQKFEQLFKEHIRLGGEFIDALKMHKPIDEIAEKAYANGKEIADFLSQLFPSTAQQEWESMMKEHVMIELNQAHAYMHNDNSRALSLKDDSIQQLRRMSDSIIKGIEKEKK
jgi:hypothetical protein